VIAHEHIRNRHVLPLDDCPLALPVPGFETSTTRIAPGETLLIDDGEWNGALNVVTAVSVDLECHGGATHSFPAGSILWFSDLGLRALHNHDTSTAVLVSTTRISSVAATWAAGNRPGARS
jgi:hypothetical protein